MKALTKPAAGARSNGGGGSTAPSTSGGRGNAFAQDQLERKAQPSLSRAQDAGKAAFREGKGDVREQFRTWREGVLTETGNIPGTEEFRADSTGAWRTFDDRAHAMWESKRARIADADLDEGEAVTEVEGSLGELEADLVERETRVEKELRTTWGNRGAKVRWQEIRRSARETVDGWEADALAGIQDAERKEALSREIDEALLRYDTSAKEARLGVQQWIEATPTFTEPDAVAEVQTRMGAPWVTLDREVKAIIEQARTLSVDVPFYSQLVGGPDFAAGTMQCFYASKSMAEHTEAPGEDVTVTGPGSRIQVATAEDARGEIDIDAGEAQAGVEYIDSQLELGRPIVVGVSCFDDGYNADAITDHFVTINGRRGEGKGAIYTYLDPWATDVDRAKGEFACGSDYKLVAEVGLLGRYEVSMVRRNA